MKNFDFLEHATKRLKIVRNFYKPHYKCKMLLSKVIDDLKENQILLFDILNAKTENLMDIIKNDKKLYEHSKNVAELSYKIAKKMNFNEEDCDQIYIGAFIHDIGKLFSNNYNNKKIINGCEKAEHAILGDILMYLRNANKKYKKNNKNNIVEKIVSLHHQRENICSELCYPFNLPFNSKTMTFQIVQPADTFDAMYRRGIYQKNFNISEIINHFKKGIKEGLYAKEPVIELIAIINEQVSYKD